MRNTVILLENVGKTYCLGKTGGMTTIQESFRNIWNRKGSQEQRIKTTFDALKHINLEIKKGERVAVIGRNGAGKSTLLKLLSRITVPDSGTIKIKGKISGMLEVGTGFHGELTGRENIYLNGSILGMSRKEIDEKIEDIIEFSECRKFIDTPVKRYSSGMYVKLGFSVAAHLNADIFLMDEVLAVGDLMFQKKCLEKMRDISENQEKTILYVSHNMETIRHLCERCIVLQNGELIFDGEAEKGIRIYMQDVLTIQNSYQYENGRCARNATNHVRIHRIDIENPVVTGTQTILKMEIFFSGEQNISGIHIRFTVHDAEDRVVGTGISAPFFAEAGKKQSIILKFDTESLVSGEYSADLAVVEPRDEMQIRHDYIERAIAFGVEKQEAVYRVAWSQKGWGSIRFPELEISRVVRANRKETEQ